MTATQFDTGHGDMIHGARQRDAGAPPLPLTPLRADTQLDYYGRKLATCSSDRLVKIFELAGEARSHVADLAGHEGPVRLAALACRTTRSSAHRCAAGAGRSCCQPRARRDRL